MNQEQAEKIAEKFGLLLDNQDYEKVKYYEKRGPLTKFIADLNAVPLISFAVDDWGFLKKLEELLKYSFSENIWVLFNLQNKSYEIYIFSNDNVLRLGSPCPFCKVPT